MQKSITLLSSFQATVQDYNQSRDAAAAREKGKMENCYLEKGAGEKRGTLAPPPEMSTSGRGPGGVRGSWLPGAWPSPSAKCTTRGQGGGGGGEALAQGDRAPVLETGLSKCSLLRAPSRTRPCSRGPVLGS